MDTLQIGVLAFHGDVIEHMRALEKAAQKLKLNIKIFPVRTRKALKGLDGLIIPGGESTTLYKLCERENMIRDMKRIRAIFGTCAGAILLAKNVLSKASDQQTLELLDITIDRNAYGSQTDSFSKNLNTTLGNIDAVFIRAPKILAAGPKVKVLSRMDSRILACEQKSGAKYYLACCFHPELTSTLFHEHFLKQLQN